PAGRDRGAGARGDGVDGRRAGPAARARLLGAAAGAGREPAQDDGGGRRVSAGGPVLGLAEIVLWVRDMDRALAFYRDLFGLTAISPPELRNRFLRAGPDAGAGAVPEMIVLVPHPDP